MRTHYFALALLVTALALTGCVAIEPTPGAGRITPQPTATPLPPDEPPAPTDVPAVPAAVTVVQAAVAREYGVDASVLQIVRWTETQWPDSCLGATFSEKPCLDVITPGYLIVFDLNGTQIEVHSNLDGSRYVVIPAEGQPDPILIVPFVDALRKALAAELGIADPATLVLKDAEEVEWPDSCLGVRTGRPCLDVITPGYRLWFAAGDKLYDVHTNADGSKYAIVQNVLPAFAADLRAALAKSLQMPAYKIKLDRGEKVDWPDSCLGVQDREMACAQVITPGYKLVYLADGQEVEVHTNADGTQWRLAAGPQGELPGAVLRWQGQIGDACARLQVSAAGRAAWGRCEGDLQNGPLAEGKRQAELAHFLAEYMPIIVDYVDGGLTFNGQGGRTLESSEIRALGEWAQWVWTEQQSGAAGAAVLTWSRQGGTGNACDTLTLYAGGVYYRENCKAQNPAIAPHFLTAGQLDQLYAWLDQYARFEITGQPGADGAQLSITFAGLGTAQTSDREQQPVMDWATALYSQ